MYSVQPKYRSSPLRAAAWLCLLSLVLAPPLLASSPAATPSDAQVRSAAEVLYVHGMTAAIAEAEVGPAGVLALLRLLRDPAFERRDNVVAFLAYLGDARTVPELLAYLERNPFPVSAAAEDRALLLVPEALGRIAGRTGDALALEALLNLTSGDAAREPGLVKTAVRGLMFSRASEAHARLEDLAQRRIVPVVGRDLAGAAAECLAWLDGTSAGNSSSAPAPTPANAQAVDAGIPEPSTLPRAVAGSSGAGAPVAPLDFDTSTFAHDLQIEFANHVNLASQFRMSDSRLDEMLEVATEFVGLEDFPGDVACCATLTRSAPGTIFGSSGDGLDVINTSEELQTVLAVPVARVKVVRQIGWCGGEPTTNTIGCARVSGFGLAVVRYGQLAQEAVLWTHEFGHNLGMVHTDDGRYIMNGSISAVGGLYANECGSFHLPPPRAEVQPETVGFCSDVDGDGRHEVIDNCPDVSNANQADSDLDGAGNACDNCVTTYNPGQHDDDLDSLGDHCDNCRWESNPDQADADTDDVGDVCDNCPEQSNRDQGDGDQDFVGDVCDNCPTDGNAAQENSDNDSFGDACDNCPLQFNPAQADFDEDAVGDVCEQGAQLADANGSGQVDGFDLVSLGRAFGSRNTDPNYEVRVDLDRNGRVDGEDLALMAQYFGDSVE